MHAVIEGAIAISDPSREILNLRNIEKHGMARVRGYEVSH